MHTRHLVQMELATPESERNVARFLLFSGCLCWLAASFYFAVGFASEAWGPASGLLEMLLSAAGGLCLALGWVRLSRQDHVRLENGQVVVESGRRRNAIAVGDDAVVELHVERRNTVRGPAFSWGIFLQSGCKRQPVMVRDEYYLEFRNLAEMLARGLGCPLVDRSSADAPIEIPATELDLPFRERVRRRPDLLGDPVECPSRSPVRVVETGEGRIYAWRGSFLRTSGLLLPVAVILYLGLYFSGLTAMADPRVELLLGGLLLFGCLLPLAYEGRLVLGPHGIDFQQSVQGVSVTNQSIPWSQVEEIRVLGKGGTTRIEVFSDREQISLGTSLDAVGEAGVALWMASEIRDWAARH